MSYLRKILLFLIAVAMVAVGLLIAAFAVLAHSAIWFVAGGAVLAFIGLWLLWEDFIAPLFARR
jgi:putative Mn2+ efflux pump MntP